MFQNLSNCPNSISETFDSLIQFKHLSCSKSFLEHFTLIYYSIISHVFWTPKYTFVMPKCSQKKVWTLVFSDTPLHPTTRFLDPKKGSHFKSGLLISRWNQNCNSRQTNTLFYVKILLLVFSLVYLTSPLFQGCEGHHWQHCRVREGG